MIFYSSKYGVELSCCPDCGVGGCWSVMCPFRAENDVVYMERFHHNHRYWNYDLSYNEAVNLITTGNIPDAIVCGNDAVAGSVIKAFDDYYPGYHISICGQDADIAACQYVVRGKQDFTIYKPISQLSELAAEYAVQLASGKKVSDIVTDGKTINNGYGDIPVVWLEPKVVEKSNIDDIIIKSGFHTYGEVYR